MLQQYSIATCTQASVPLLAETKIIYIKIDIPQVTIYIGICPVLFTLKTLHCIIQEIKYHAFYFKVKNAITELSVRTMIVPVFTKGVTSKGFSFTSRLLHPAINLKYHIKYITLATRNS